MWHSQTSASYTSFGSPSIFTSAYDVSVIQKSIGQVTSYISLVNTIAPIDYKEYLGAILTDTSMQVAVSDVEPSRSLQ